MIPIYRFKFSELFTEELYAFANIHKYDERKCFQEAWTRWLDDHTDLVQEEVERLKSEGDTSNIVDKMYKSARYYFKKKSLNMTKKETKQRKIYLTINKNTLKVMDDFIWEQIRNQDCKPSIIFHTFCERNTDLIRSEIRHLIQNGMTDNSEIKNKIKKTYKNRYFIISNMMSSASDSL